MNKEILRIIILSVCFFFIVAGPGFCLDGSDAIKLKKAGINDETVQLIIKEKIIETCAFTVQEILKLKEAGLSDKTIRMLIENGSFMKDREPVVYGENLMSIKFTRATDIIKLKDAGVSDEVIQAVITCGSKSNNDSEKEKAWKMLENMGIMMDLREPGGY